MILSCIVMPICFASPLFCVGVFLEMLSQIRVRNHEKLHWGKRLLWHFCDAGVAQFRRLPCEHETPSAVYKPYQG